MPWHCQVLLLRFWNSALGPKYGLNVACASTQELIPGFLALERSSLLGCASNRQYLKNLGSRSLWSPRPSVQMTGDQLLAIGKQDLQHTPEGLPILDWLQSDGNFVARLEGVLTKATGGYASRRLSLHNPMNYWSVIIVY